MNEDAQLNNKPDQSGVASFKRTFAVVFQLFRVVVVIVVLWQLLYKGFYSVEEGHEAFQLRFGERVVQDDGELMKAGRSYWLLPEPIDRVESYNTRSQLISSNTFWFSLDPLLDDDQRAELKAGRDGYLLSAEGTPIHCQLVLSYKIFDPVKYHNSMQEPIEIIGKVFDNAVLQTMAGYTSSEAVYKVRNSWLTEVKQRTQDALEDLNSGVNVLEVSVKFTPPHAVSQAYFEHHGASEKSSTLVTDARSEAGQIITKAKQQAAEVISEGQRNGFKFVESIKADVAVIEGLLKEKGQLKEVLAARYYETLARVLEKAGEKFVLDEEVIKGLAPLKIRLNRQPKKEKRFGN